MNAPQPSCGRCTHFCNDAFHLERSFPGLASMSSGLGATRAEDGICSVHGLYLDSRASCTDFLLRNPTKR